MTRLCLIGVNNAAASFASSSSSSSSGFSLLLLHSSTLLWLLRSSSWLDDFKLSGEPWINGPGPEPVSWSVILPILPDWGITTLRNTVCIYVCMCMHLFLSFDVVTNEWFYSDRVEWVEIRILYYIGVTYDFIHCCLSKCRDLWLWKSDLSTAPVPR